MPLLIFIALLLTGSFSALAVALPQPVDSVLIIGCEIKSLPEMAYAWRDDFHTVRCADKAHITKIGDYAFIGCRNLRKVELPPSLVSIGMGVFQDCDLRELKLPARIKKIPRYMCAWNENLSAVHIPSGVDDIGSHAFAYCSNLQNTTLPSRLKHIGSNAFSRCRSLTNMKLPTSITELESYVFSDCTALRHVTLPANPSLLGEYIFSGCTALEEIEEMSLTPPSFDCGSPLHDDSDPDFTQRVRLKTRPAAVSLYRNAPIWSDFRHIAP